MAEENGAEDEIGRDGLIAGDDIRKAAALLLKLVNVPTVFGDSICQNCRLSLHDRLSQLAVTTEDVRIISNAEETSTAHDGSDFNGSQEFPASVPLVDKNKLWSEIPCSSSESDDEETVPVTGEVSEYESDSETSASQYESDSKTEASQCGSDLKTSAFHNVESPVVQNESTPENVVVVPPRVFKNDNFKFAWANVALNFQAAGDDQKGPLTPGKVKESPTLSREQREQLRFLAVQRKKDFESFERVRGKMVNTAAGLELHAGVFSSAEQTRLVELVKEYQEKGRNKQLRERTYSEPRKWMRGKGRITIQFGCCYNYAVDRNGNPPGILHENLVDPLPPLLRATIRRMVRWHVIPPTCVPDSCIINIYDEGDCIPPHIDHHDFERPFCTLSLVSTCKIVFGSELKIVGPGEFSGPLSIPLPVGSVLVLQGNGADVAKHAVPAVPSTRISITFRKMDPRKVPDGYELPKDLQNVGPLILERSRQTRPTFTKQH